MSRGPKSSLRGLFHAALATVVLAPLASQTAWAQLPTPRLTSVFPCGARQATQVEVELQGSDLADTTRLLFSHPGLSAERLPDEANKPLRFKITVGADVPVGDYDLRLVARFGVSNPRTFVVGDREEIREQEPNNLRTQATRVPLEGVANGQINPGEDVDWYVFSAKAGQRVICECWGKRIDSRVDGYLWLQDSAGRELGVSQDETIRDEKTDSMIDVVIPADGDYFLKFTDFTYNGSGDHFYRLNVNTSPLIDFVLPTGVKTGEPANVTLFGRNLPGGEATDWQINGHALVKLVRPVAVSAEQGASLQFGEVVRAPASRLNGVEIRLPGPPASNAHLLVASQLSELLEHEPNNKPEEAQRLTVPCAVSGQFSPAKDLDWFIFAGTKGKIYTVEVFAQRIGSPADPDMEVQNAQGNVIATPQDDGENIGQLRFASFTRDLRHELTAGEDGDIKLRLEHLFGQIQGGPQFVYRLELSERKQDFQLICQPPHETRMDSHTVRQGGRERADVLVWRLQGYNAPITVSAKNLPAGVTAEPVVIGPGVKWGTLVLTAAADAPLGESVVEIVGTAEVEGAQVERRARGGAVVWDTNNTPAICRLSRSIVVAVREKAPFTVTATPAAATLKQGEPLVLTMAVARPADLAGVQLTGAGYQLPQGLEIPLTAVPAGQAQVGLTLKTDKIAPGTYSFIINCEAQVPFEIAPNNKPTMRVVYPSNAVTLTIAPPEAKN